MATIHAAGLAAEGNLILLDDAPVAVRSDPLSCVQRYTFYATSAANATANVTASVHHFTDAVRRATRDLETHISASLFNTTQSTAGTVSDTVNYVWPDWNATGGGQFYWRDATGNTANGSLIDFRFNPYVEPPEQAAARKEREAKLVVVRQRAERLFYSGLTEAQRQTWDLNGYADVLSARGRRYRIKNGRSGNVFLLDAAGREVRKYCAYANDPGGYLPDGDHWYTQMLTLKYDETTFLRAANTWDLLRNGVFVGQGVDADREVPEALAA